MKSSPFPPTTQVPPKPKPSRPGPGPLAPQANTIGNTIGNPIGNYKICLKNCISITLKSFLRGSGGLLGPSWTFPDTSWTIQQNFKILTNIAPKDLLRPPRHIPDDPKNFNNISKTCQNVGIEPWTWPLGYGRWYHTLVLAGGAASGGYFSAKQNNIWKI